MKRSRRGRGGSNSGGPPTRPWRTSRNSSPNSGSRTIVSRHYLLDTDILVYWSTRHPTYERYRDLLEGAYWSLSVVSVGELGLLARRDGMEGLERIEVRRRLGGIVTIPVDETVAGVWGKITAALGRNADRKTNDLWIAATALAHGLPLVTNNPRDFDGIEGIEVLTR